jgi:c-di-AMP phosphodiesterase-like protein
MNNKVKTLISQIACTRPVFYKDDETNEVTWFCPFCENSVSEKRANESGHFKEMDIMVYAIEHDPDCPFQIAEELYAQICKEEK